MNQSLILKARRRLLQMHYEAKTGHIGGNLSCLKVLMTLYHDVMKPEDQFILSKGHAAGSLYVTLWSKGILTDEQLRTFHQDDTHLPGHVPSDLHGSVPFSTGSLGHGVSLACGLALAKRLRSEPGRVYCLTSDGEYGEGSTWEGLMFAKHHKLSNLTIIVDVNGWQGFGSTQEVSGIDGIRGIYGLSRGLSERIGGFGVGSLMIWKYDYGKMVELMKEGQGISECFQSPGMVLVETVKGHGVSFLENRMESHYDPLSREQYEQAMKENEG